MVDRLGHEQKLELERVYRSAAGRLLLMSELKRSLQMESMEQRSWEKLLQAGAKARRLHLTPGIIQDKTTRWGWLPQTVYRCRRCGSGEETIRWSYCAACKRQCPTCQACLQMGKVRGCSILVHGLRAGEAVFSSASNLSADYGTHSPSLLQEEWGLSPAQSKATNQALRFMQSGSPGSMFLFWAVTGAGKTEMLFPIIDAVTKRGGLVCIATPRKDVVIELEPRLKERFPAFDVAVLYGGSDPTWSSPALTISTTHQLLRFEHAFDLVVIDEVDAFPYHGDPMLGYAAQKAIHPGGKRIFLSATPPAELQRAAAKGRLAHVKVPCRYHGHPLPVPQLITAHSPRKRWDKLVKLLARSLARGAQLFLFVPKITETERIVKALRRVLPRESIEGTSSVDPDRANKVEQFRKREIRLLVTTTILERGVTVARSDVFVYDADAPLFDEAALVQMAGRAGRKMEDPSGFVYFFVEARTRSTMQAIKQIKAMNKVAKRSGYIR